MILYRPIIEGDLQLADANGENVKTVRYTIDVNKSYKTLTQKRAALAAQADVLMSTGDDEAAQKLGEMFNDILVEIFGFETASEIVRWYGSNGADLVWLMLPVLLQEIFPALDRQREQVMQLRKSVNKYAAEQETADGD